VTRDPFDLARLDPLMTRTRASGVRIGLIDGAVEGGHPALATALIETPGGDGTARCMLADSLGCRHGTFLASLLVGNGALGIRGICPDATLVSLPVFAELPGPGAIPSVRPEALADAIHRLIDAGTQVINLSVGIAAGSPRAIPEMLDACSRARAAGTLLVAASGNQARLGPVWLFADDWVIPVAASLADGSIDLRSNLGPGIGRRGLSAPAAGIRGALAPDKAGIMGGSSVATAFVTGALALLRSFYPRLPAPHLREALLLEPRRARSIVPPPLDAAASLAWLEARHPMERSAA
jgi:subtilisin family serine protease